MKSLKCLALLAAWLVPAALYAQGGAVLRADFDPTAGKVPNPTSLFFRDSLDGTFNIPVPDDSSAAVVEALNVLDGASTVAPILATFSNGVIPGLGVTLMSPIDETTLVGGDTVRLYEVALANPFATGNPGDSFQVQGVVAELTPEVDYSVGLLAADVDVDLSEPVDPARLTVVIKPLKPLKPKTGYLVVLTNGIRADDAVCADDDICAGDGSPAWPDTTYILARYRGLHHRPYTDANGRSNFPGLTDAQAQSIEALAPVVKSQEAAAHGQGVPFGSIVLSWTFMTQSIGDVLTVVRAQNTSAPDETFLVPTGATTAAFVPALPGVADVYVGETRVDYYLEDARSTQDTRILTTRWTDPSGGEVTRYNPSPAVKANLPIPVLATIPNAASGWTQPAGGWPTVIMQHGVTVNRQALLAVADTLALAGFAVIGIDLPLHGITDTTNPLYVPGRERTFDLDLLPLPTADDPTLGDGVTDSSGSHFINLGSLVTSRDNLRQAASDLFTLTKVVPTIDLDGDAAADFDGDRLAFLGHSLGGIAGTTFLGLEEDVWAASLANPGGGIAQLLSFSGGFGPEIDTGLAQVGIFRGTAEFEAFLDAAQTLLDSGDAINYGAAAAALHPIHLIEVVAVQPPPLDQAIPDGVIPNATPIGPLSGTDPLAEAMGLTQIDSTATDADGLRALVRFTEGDHSSLLLTTASPAATVEMQGEVAGFLASDGLTVPIGNEAVVEQLP